MANNIRRPKRMRRIKVRQKSDYFFTSTFEERKVYQYLGNIINSRLLRRGPLELLQFSKTLLGQDSILELLSVCFPRVTENAIDSDRFEVERVADNLTEDELVILLKEEVAPLLSRQKHSRASSNSDIENRLMALKRAFNLSEEELEIVSFMLLMETSPLLIDYLDNRGGFGDFSDITTFRNYGNIVLGMHRGKFLTAFASGNLFKSRIIEKCYGGSLRIMEWGSEYLSGMGSDDIRHELFEEIDSEALNISEFEVSSTELKVFNTLIKRGVGQNILLYGSQGTGKSSFALTLARRYKRKLLKVKAPTSDDHSDWLHAIVGTVNLAEAKRAIVLVDEADEILNSSSSLFFKSKTNKSWINEFLESHPKTVIWITNRTSEIEKSTMRRFAFSLEFKELNRIMRLKVLRHELERRGLENYFDSAALEELCGNYKVDAGGIVNAISVLRGTRGIKQEAALNQIRTVLRNHEKATGSGRSGSRRIRDFGSYSLTGLNTSRDMKEIVSVAGRFIRLRDNMPCKSSRPLALLLYGAPGTGKSEFVYYLGNALGEEVLLKRCSDIQSMWVGETEKQIADAFREAEERGHILFFDEADSFLFPRRDASHSWERSFTNEILTQMESFKGIAVFATNEMDTLDHASLRRFRYKVEFKPLTPEGNLRFYETLLNPLVGRKYRLSPSDKKRIEGIGNLTPGDFAIVKDQAMLLEPAKVSHRNLIESLISEAGYKKKQGSAAGFL